jgi:crotonobetainyl-CoA:carnitine CoA-transferase CaiB-like acyl-CoA transferase
LRVAQQVQPLEGVRVVDLTQTMAGPYCTMILGDLGADVIKVEPPVTGEMTRTMGFGMTGDDSAAFLAINRNKRSITLDLKASGAREAVHALIATADVVVENFRPGVADRLGVGWDELHAQFPALVHASISGFGQTGPYAQRPGFDLIAQGMAGVMSVTGEPGGDPVKSGMPVGDLSAGLYCAVAIVSALVGRQRTGDGRRIDVSLFESALSLAVWESAELFATGRIPERTGSAHRLTAPYQALRTADGWVTVGANTPALWALLCRTIGRDDLLEDERFLDNDGRMRDRLELQHELERTLAGADTATWVERFDAAGFPAGPLNDYGQVLADPHTLARGMLQEFEHPVEGVVRTIGSALGHSGAEGGVRRPPPLLGEHNDEVLGEVLGVDGLARLRASGASGPIGGGQDA